MAVDILSSIGSYAESTTNTLSGYVWPVIWSLVVLGFIGFVWWYLQYRHKIRLRLLTNYGSVPYDDKAREVLVDGVPFWKLLKRKDIIPVPSKKCLNSIGRDFFGKPKFYAEMYWSEEEGYIPVQDTVNKENLAGVVKVLDETGERVVTGAFQPFTTQQRALHVAQLRRAEERRKNDFLTTIQNLAVPGILAMILILGLVFWEDIAKPGKEMALINKEMLEKQNVIAQQLADASSQNARVVQALAEESKKRELQISQVLREGES